MVNTSTFIEYIFLNFVSFALKDFNLQTSYLHAYVMYTIHFFITVYGTTKSVLNYSAQNYSVINRVIYLSLNFVLNATEGELN